MNPNNELEFDKLEKTNNNNHFNREGIYNTTCTWSWWEEIWRDGCYGVGSKRWE
jgi:hypothetical protein